MNELNLLSAHEYLSSKMHASGTRDLCPANTPALKMSLNGALQVLPPLKMSNSQERTSNCFKTSKMESQRTLTGELDRVEAFKKRDLRGGKRTRQPHLSVGKSLLQQTSVRNSNKKSERKMASIAMASPSTQDESLRRTISSKDNNSTSVRFDENLHCSPFEALRQQSSALQVIENLEFANPMEEMTRRWQANIEKVIPAIDLVDIAAEGNPFESRKRQFAPEFSQSSYE